MSTLSPTVTEDAFPVPPAAAPSFTKAQRPAHAPTSNTTPLRKNDPGDDHYATKTKAEADFVQLLEADTTRSMPTFKDKFFSSLAHETNENDTYELFIMKKAMDSVSLPGLQPVNTAHNSDPNTPTSRRGKPDISVYKHDFRDEPMELLFEFKPPGAPEDPLFEDALRSLRSYK